MLREFITAHRDEILDLSSASLAAYFPDRPPARALPRFLDGLLQAFARHTHPHQHREPCDATIKDVAIDEGRTRQAAGEPIDVVVRGFGAVCDAITSLASAEGNCIDAEDMWLLNLCIDDAIAVGITAYAAADGRAADASAAQRIGHLAHEVRNAAAAAAAAFEALQAGRIAPQGATAEILGRSLRRIQNLVAYALAGARLEAGESIRPTRWCVAEALHELASMFRLPHGVGLRFEVDDDLELDADADLFGSAVGNVLQNALKFTRPGGRVIVRARAQPHELVVEVEDQCGGLGVDPEQLFRAFHQGSADGCGAGLGLAIAREAVEAHGGAIRARDLPGVGCVFVLTWPRGR